MKKIISLILCIMCLGCLFACSTNNSDENATEQATQQGDSVNDASAGSEIVTHDVDLTAVKYQIIDNLGIEGVLDMDAAMLLNMYGIAEEDIKNSACFTGIDAVVFPDEIVMIEATDSEAAERIEEKLEVRIEAVLAQSKSYDPENYAIAQKCKVITNGNYVAMFVSAQHESMQEIYLGAILSE